MDIDLIKHMEAVGRRILEEKHPRPAGNTDQNFYRIGFHVPPYNSVFHLHLHIVGMPCAIKEDEEAKFGSCLRPVSEVLSTLVEKMNKD